MKPESNRDEFWQGGLHFTCTSCGHCCRHEPGYVFLSETDLKVLSAHLKLSADVFTERFCRSVDLGIARRLSLNETAENDCVFWDGGCTVYKARPLQCRTYPFWPSILASRADWDWEALECPGMNQGKKHANRTIEAQLRQREREILISPKR